jgi:PAS domain S-box-containing protein
MDYLLFLTGLFLIASAVASFFLYQEDKSLSRWALFSVALVSLCLKIWFSIVAFAFDLGEAHVLVRSLLGSLFAASLLGFFLSPLLQGQKTPFFIKWLAILALFGITIWASHVSLASPFFITPILAVSFAAGWRVDGFSRRLFPSETARYPLASALLSATLLTIITAVCLLPQAVEVAYDARGQAHSIERVSFLVALASSTLCSFIFCFRLWSVIYQANRSQFSKALLRRRRIGTSVILVAAFFTILNGAGLTHWLGNQAQQKQTTTLLSALQLGADNLDSSLIEKVQGIPDDVQTPTYRSIRAKLLDIQKALPGCRFTYLLGMRGESLVFLVDAEDANKTETFSPPGLPVTAQPEKWQPALEGKPSFLGPYSDVWGIWFSAVVPVFDDSKNVLALLAVDYPASNWLQPLAARRLAAMVVVLSVALLLIALFAFHLAAVKTARHLESLSERLTDAMTAADLDTWECFLRPFKINLGDRISALLGWPTGKKSLSFRKVWKLIHPDDRSQLLGLIRSSDDIRGTPPEYEIRLQSSKGQWLWFMVRGRIVRPLFKERTRIVGTILNIDERHRTRLETDKQRQFAQHVMESVPNGLAVVTSEGLITYANPAFVNLSRCKPESLVGQPLTSLISYPSQSSNPDSGFEGILTRPDRKLIPVQVFRAPLSDSPKNTGSILSIVDLTSAKEAELDLIRSRAEANRLALVAKRTDNAVVITDSVGHIEWVNEGFTKISGYTKEEVIGKIPGHFLQRPGDNQEQRTYIRDRIQRGLGFETELMNFSKNGRFYLIHIECQPLVDKYGTLTGFMAIQRDTTQTRRSSNLLEAVASISTTLLSKRIGPSLWGEILAALGRAANVDRSYIFQVHQHPILSTPCMSQIAEWTSTTSNQAQKNPRLHNLPFHESGLGRWFSELLAGHEISGVVEFLPESEQKILQPRGIRSLVIVPIFAANRLWGFLGLDACFEDRIWQPWEISILRSAAANFGLRQVAQSESDALVLARDESHNAAIVAEKANRAKSTFLATMSHEIRTPLNAVIGMASLLETTNLNAQQKDYAETILNSSNFLLELINDILDYSRIESGNIDLDSSPFHLPDLCREAFDVVRLGAMGKKIELIARLAPHLPNQVEGDRARIRQILVNLLSNAVKFTPAGFVSLIVDGKQSHDGRWHITFEVKDSGIGIDPSTIKRLFNAFVQQDSSTTRRFGGSGLGLAISKRLAELMGGDITIQSALGEGATFLADLYVKPSSLAPSVSSPIAHLPEGLHLKILIVDDNPINRRILEEMLASWGLSCHIADSGAQALQQWEHSGPYDLVIVDQHMPEMDGIQLAQHLRSRPNSSNTRFSLLSSEANYSAETRALFDEVGPKPIWPSAVQGILTRLFPGTVVETTKITPATDESESTRLTNLQILVAEDNPNNQKVIRLLLRRLGIEPYIVANGQEAVDAANSAAYDIIFLDIQMPVMDGLEASRAIRKLPPQAKRPFIVALTANAFQEDRDAASAAGMDAYLSKPITLNHLRDMISSIISPNSTLTTN